MCHAPLRQDTSGRVPIYHEIERLEAALRLAPDDPALRERLLFAYAEDDRTLADPRRVGHIRWFITHRPDDEICRSPLTQPDPRRQPAAYAAIVDEWRRATEAHPDNHLVTRAAALLLALDRPEDGRALLERALGEVTRRSRAVAGPGPRAPGSVEAAGRVPAGPRARQHRAQPARAHRPHRGAGR